MPNNYKHSKHSLWQVCSRANWRQTDTETERPIHTDRETDRHHRQEYTDVNKTDSSLWVCWWQASQTMPRLGTHRGGNITSVGWQVTLCDPIWHVSSRSGVATLRTAIHLLLTQTDGQVESIMPPAETAGPHDGSRETDCTEGETTFMAIELFQLPV